jgi:hypothetical protein
VAGYRLRHALRDVVRLGWFVIRGHGRWVRKAWTFFTYADLRADARAARVTGDPDRRRTAQELIRADARSRWARVGMAVERAGGGALGAGLVGLLLWLVAQVLPRDDMWPCLADLYDVLAWIGTAAARFGPAVLWLTVVGVVVAAAFEGRDRTPGAGWLIHPDRTDADSWVDERMISQALAHLGIAPMDRFFKDGAQLAYTVPARVDGNGTYAQVRLAMGVTAGMVADRRDRLAANLGRAKLETWPTEGGEAGLLDLWVADRGVLGRGAGRWPLLDDGQVDGSGRWHPCSTPVALPEPTTFLRPIRALVAPSPRSWTNLALLDVAQAVYAAFRESTAPDSLTGGARLALQRPPSCTDNAGEGRAGVDDAAHLITYMRDNPRGRDELTGHAKADVLGHAKLLTDTYVSRGELHTDAIAAMRGATLICQVDIRVLA